MRASVCVGNYATIPYIIEELELSVFSLEELCYCLKENAFLLDVTLMNDVLLGWIENECGVKELAKELYPLVHKKGSLSAFVSMILEYTGFYGLEVINEVEHVLKQGAGLSNIEKRKKQIDFLAAKKKYIVAIHGYDALLERWQTAPEEELPAANVKAAILYNKGVVLSQLMLYGQAAEAFLAADELWSCEDYAGAYLAAKRMELPEAEKKLEGLLKDFRGQAAFMQRQQDELLQELMDEYRNCVAE